MLQSLEAPRKLEILAGAGGGTDVSHSVIGGEGIITQRDGGGGGEGISFVFPPLPPQGQCIFFLP